MGLRAYALYGLISRKGGTRVVSNQRGYVLPWSKTNGKDGV